MFAVLATGRLQADLHTLVCGKRRQRHALPVVPEARRPEPRPSQKAVVRAVCAVYKGGPLPCTGPRICRKATVEAGAAGGVTHSLQPPLHALQIIPHAEAGWLRSRAADLGGWQACTRRIWRGLPKGSFKVARPRLSLHSVASAARAIRIRRRCSTALPGGASLAPLSGTAFQA